MSAETGSSTSPIEIYVPLLNEGTEVIRPTKGLAVGPGEFQLLPTPNYDPADEEWAFPPGTKVRCVQEIWSGLEVLVARQRVA